MKKILSYSLVLLAILGYASVVTMLLAVLGLVRAIIQIGDPEAISMGIFIFGLAYGPIILLSIILFIVTLVGLLWTSTINLKTGLRIAKSMEPAITFPRKLKISVVLSLLLIAAVLYEVLPLTIYFLDIK